MDNIEQIIDRIEKTTIDYQRDLMQFESVMKTSPLASIFDGTVGEQINHQTRAYNLLNQYIVLRTKSLFFL